MKSIFTKTCLAVTALITTCAYSQTVPQSNTRTDSLYIAEIEDITLKPKVLHAEPLYIDLIRDLGARKGEKEWNVGVGLTDNNNYDKYTALIEYEWAPIDRLCLEVELPFSFYYPVEGTTNMRPQMRVGISKQLLAGIVTGIPISRENERFSSFIRLIYEPH